MERISYKCNKCKYRFSRKADIKFSVCPYCGTGNCVEIDTGDTASRILDEVSKYERMD
ncbi:hypothetical protein JXB41_05815 [Candidatus Woesearchaeota archaeon]|nr:hypothetical protein [Candidatus Woesearchaeota archaeon]